LSQKEFNDEDKIQCLNHQIGTDLEAILSLERMWLKGEDGSRAKGNGLEPRAYSVARRS